MIVTSIIKEHNPVSFPAFLGERHYMREFKKSTGLPTDLKHWQPTIDQMLEGVNSGGSVFLMIDQSRVVGGSTHRRGGLHVDLVWGMGADSKLMGWKEEEPKWNEPTKPGVTDQLILLVSDVVGCNGYNGEWDNRLLGKKGDCTAVSKDNLQQVVMKAGVTYVGSAFHTLHESVPIQTDCNRTVVRLHVNLH